MSMIAIGENSDPKMLAPSNEAERVLRLEECANCDPEVMKREMSDGKQDWREGRLSLIHREKGDQTILEDMTESANFQGTARASTCGDCIRLVFNDTGPSAIGPRYGRPWLTSA